MSVRLVLAALATAAIAACTSSQTSVTAPTTSDRCDVHATTNTSTFTSAGGNATIAVATTRDCTWTITTDNNWVTISGARSGQGEASVAYAVAANPVPTARSGAIVVGGDRVELSQAAAPCRFSLSRASDSIASSGGRLSVDVSTLSGCSWTAASTQSWIAVASGQSGNSNGTVVLSIASNNSARRVGMVNVAGQIYTVTQDATPAPTPGPSPIPTPPGPTPPPTPTPPPPSGDLHLEGSASGVSGGCPNISFSLGGTLVVADGSTDYKKGGCSDVRNGRDLKVDGVQTGGTVKATQIQLGKGNDDQG